MAAFREPGNLTGTDSLVSEILGGLKLVLSKCFTIRKPENSHCTLVVTLLTTFCCSLSISHCERARDNAFLQTDCLNLAESSPSRKAPYSTQVNLTVMHNKDAIKLNKTLPALIALQPCTNITLRVPSGQVFSSIQHSTEVSLKLKPSATNGAHIHHVYPVSETFGYVPTLLS